MSYNPNKYVDTDVCKGIEKLFDALRRKGIVLKSIELSKELTLFGKSQPEVLLDLGLGYNRRHIKVNVANKADAEGTDLRAADPDTNNKGTNTSQSSAQGKE